jgi:hypothetical protein
MKQQDLITELSAVCEGEGLSTQEIMVKLNRGIQWVRKKLSELNSQGRLSVNKRSITRVDGSRQVIPVYAIKPLEKK